MSSQPILIVDDNVDNLMLTQILLESEGFEVRMAEDAIQAIDLLRSYRPKLILMDIQMPGMDGLELTRKLRRDVQFENVMIVALTAYAMRGDEEAARSAGCDGYITKPINTRTFPTSVRAFFDA
jgi:CheY-like chemotaxis protein